MLFISSSDAALSSFAAPSASAHAANDVTETSDNPNATFFMLSMRAPYFTFARRSSVPAGRAGSEPVCETHPGLRAGQGAHVLLVERARVAFDDTEATAAEPAIDSERERECKAAREEMFVPER